MYSQKYCLVQLLSPMGVGDEFAAKDWPLHCTIAGVFALDWTNDTPRSFADMVAEHQSFKTVTTDIALFGPKGTIRVRRLEMTDDLYTLHDNVVAFVEERGGDFNKPLYLRQDFAPHITMRGELPHEDETILFHQLALIDMFPDADHTRRRIVSLMPLAMN